MCVCDRPFGRDEEFFSAGTGPSAGRLRPVYSVVTVLTTLYRRLYRLGTELRALKPKTTTPERVPPLALLLVNLAGTHRDFIPK